MEKARKKLDRKHTRHSKKEAFGCREADTSWYAERIAYNTFFVETFSIVLKATENQTLLHRKVNWQTLQMGGEERYK